MQIINYNLEDKVRVDQYIANNTDISRVIVKKMLQDGNILVNNEIVKPNYKLINNDQISIEEIVEEEIVIEAEKIELDIIYEDEEMMIINKKSGMVVHPAVGNKSGTLVNALMYYSNNLSSIGGEFRPGIVHRIDKDTSGLLMVAKTDNAHKNLSEQLKAHTIKREYIALVHGTIIEEEADIIATIGRDEKNRQKMAVTKKNSKEAKTSFTVLKRYMDYTLIKCVLDTGRTHQIRVHLKYIGHPLVGDPVYGPKKTINTNGQALHAKTIGFVHPKTKEYMEFESDIPEVFKDTLKRIESE